MSEKHYMSVALPSVKVQKIDSVNREFDHVKIYTFRAGANRNYSYVSKTELDKALPSLNYLPVVGHLIEEYDSDGNVSGHYFGGHDYVVTDDLKVKMITVPYGVVISGTAQYETIDEHGQEVQYLTAEAYLWTGRYPEMRDAIYSDEVWYGQSAEITFEQWRPWQENSLYAELLDVNFSALCLLGKSDDKEKHTEPCFQSAHVEPIKTSAFALDGTQFSQLMSKLREQLAHSLEHTENQQKGGSDMNQEDRDAIFAEFSLTPSDVDFEVADEMSTEELREKLTAFVEAQKGDVSGEPDDHFGDEMFSAEGEQELEGQMILFSATYREKEESLRQAVRCLNKEEYDEQGKLVKEVYCCLHDFDDEFAYFCTNIYSKSSYEEHYCRCAYAFDEDNQASLTGEPEEVFLRWLTAEQIEKVEADANKLNELIQFKQSIEETEFATKRDELIGKFADVSGLEEFAAIKEEAEARKAGNLEDLEMKLFALRGKQVKFEKPARDNSRVGIDYDADGEEDDGYGGLLNRQKNR